MNKPQPTGGLIELSKGRLVFVGTREANPETLFIGLRNQEGDDLKFTVSREAGQALARLLSGDFLGKERAFPESTVSGWRAVEYVK